MWVFDGQPIGGITCSYFNTYILESSRITGPWKLVTYMKHFGEQAYFVNIPSKFIRKGGRSIWLCYAGNFSQGWNDVTFLSKPAGGRYAMSLQEIKFRNASDPIPQHGLLDGDDNIARTSIVTVSSTHPNSLAQGAIDGSVWGAVNDPRSEWASRNESKTAMIRLSWPNRMVVDRIMLFDRPNTSDQIKGGMLIFSDGSTI